MSTSSIPTFPTKQDVIRALAEQRVNRPRRLADQNIRSILHTFGNGATSIGELDPAYYEFVWRAAGGVLSAEELYGTVTDVPVIDATKSAKITITPLDVKRGDAAAPSAPPRVRSPLTLELEARLAAARAKTKRSYPGGSVDLGNASRPEDQRDDEVQDWPRGEKMS